MSSQSLHCNAQAGGAECSAAGPHITLATDLREVAGSPGAFERGADMQPEVTSPPSSEAGSAGGDSAAGEGGSDAGSEVGEGMGALGDNFDETNELAADALVFSAAEADYEQEDWGWGDLTAAAGPAQAPGEMSCYPRCASRWFMCQTINRNSHQ